MSSVSVFNFCIYLFLFSSSEKHCLDVHFVTYNVLLSYPDYAKPNRVTIVDAANHTIYRSDGISPVIIPNEQGAPG